MRQRLARVALAAATAALAGLAFASPARAADADIPINPGNVGPNGVTAADFKTHDCEDIFDFFGNVEGDDAPSAKSQFNRVTANGAVDIPVGIDGWHFVLPDASGDAFVSLSLNFTTPDGPVTVTIPGGGGDEDLYWGLLGESGGKANKHAYLLTIAGWTLTGGHAIVKRADGKTYPQDIFNLSHVCAGTPGTGTPTPGTTETPTPGNSDTPSPGTSTQPGGTPSPSSSTGGGLPVTGVAWGATALTAVGLIAAGIALMAVRRRRELTEDSAS
ncbi:MAG: hypothetical protein HOV77_26300 [Hamadaea sp.]|uniref:hypothetical protein n=1 Tax=Hamadaea sp. TaxID=2024425 RepID=UPI0017BD29D3|nr:hypothetical protein [Hamadaea sp.]NUT22697.1 hypothetical protein [Hamadaea sp.]